MFGPEMGNEFVVPRESLPIASRERTFKVFGSGLIVLARMAQHVTFPDKGSLAA